MVNKLMMIALPLATGKRKAALRMGKMSVVKSMNVGFVPLSSANLKLLEAT
ncbi:conserved hypothetical protein [Ricinus communis]|uniref:Uncharacterized protein n=1 Tax=Ricinus communis TaxID=3988 RepID=B9T051_RICCO|nr:conserved hypothetical protein [Ricinus communis]